MFYTFAHVANAASGVFRDSPRAGTAWGCSAFLTMDAAHGRLPATKDPAQVSRRGARKAGLEWGKGSGPKVANKAGTGWPVRRGSGAEGPRQWPG